MRKLTTITCILLISILFVSCSKEVSKEPQFDAVKGLTGNYKFISVEAQTVVDSRTKEDGDEDKTVTIAHYISKNNTGTIKIDATSMSSNSLSYAIDTVMRAYMYTNGILQDSLTYPFQISVPPSSAVSDYKVIGSDSIYFSSGSFVMNASSTSPSPTKPSGGHFKFEGNKLYITATINETTVQNVDELQFSSTTQANSTIILQKQ